MSHAHDQSQEEVHCPLCNKGLLSDFGLSSHLKTHHSGDEVKSILQESMEVETHKEEEGLEELSHSCNKCQKAFSSLQKLDVHNRLTHSSKKLHSELAVSLASSPVRLPQLNGLSKVLDTAIPGFCDLDFIDFTTEKFPLVAKVWCEKNPRRKSSVFHDFSCPKCNYSFPNRGALALHMASHKPNSWTSCPLCDCYFVSPDILHTHLSKHIADKAMIQALELKDNESCGKPESMDKADFMGMFELVSTKDLSQSRKNETVIESISKEQNDVYFARLIDMVIKKNAGENISNSAYSAKERDVTDTNILKCLNQGKPVAHSSFLDGGHALQSSPTLSGALGEFPSKMQSPELPSGVLSSEALMMSSPIIPDAGSSLSAIDSHPSSLSPIAHYGLQHGPRHGSFTPTSACPSPIGSEEGENLLDAKHKNVFSCKYCGQAFSNYRALKGKSSSILQYYFGTHF